MMTRLGLSGESSFAQLMTVACPECAAPAEVEWQAELLSTAGPVMHVKIRCVYRHWFLTPLETLDAGPVQAG